MRWAFLNAPRCGAKTRKGTPCKAPAMANGRCRMHGGKSPGAPYGPRNGSYRTGLWTKEAIANRKVIAALLKAARDEIDKILN